MSPEGRAWAERKIAAWSRRAAELRARPDERGAMRRAEGLDFLVNGLAARIAETAMPSAAPVADERVAKLAALRARLASSQPYMHPTYKIMFNKGPLMDDIRAEVAAKIAALEAELGEAASEAAPTPVPVAPSAPAPVPVTLSAMAAAAPMQMALAL